ILTGGIDLAIGSMVGFTGIFGGVLIKSGVPIALAIVMCLGAGALVGFVTGVLISYGKVPAFIFTLGTMQILRGVTKVITAGKPVAGLPTELANITSTEIFGIPVLILYVFILY
ncbi:MAG: ABC transporter permease, partial [Oscillospiraceae bacterium]